MQDGSISSALAMEILQSCTEPSTWVWSVYHKHQCNKCMLGTGYKYCYIVQIVAQTLHITYSLLSSPWNSQLVYMLKPKWDAKPSRHALISEWFSIKKWDICIICPCNINAWSAEICHDIFCPSTKIVPGLKVFYKIINGPGISGHIDINFKTTQGMLKT